MRFLNLALIILATTASHKQVTPAFHANCNGITVLVSPADGGLPYRVFQHAVAELATDRPCRVDVIKLKSED